MEKKNFLKQNFNYPIFLLAVFSLTNILNIIGCFGALFRSPGSILSTLLDLVVYCAPIVVAVVLWVHRTKGMEKASSVVASVFAVLALIEIYNWIIRFITVIPNISFEIGFITWNLSNLIEPLFIVITYAILSINLFTKRNKYIAFYVVSVIYIIELCFFGIIRVYAASSGMGLMSSALSGFIQVLFVIAVWYVPNAINKPEKAELSSGKAKVLGVIAAIVVALYLIGLIGAGGGSDTSKKNEGKWDLCMKCGGDGKVENALGFNSTCPRCKGVGYIP